MLITNAIRLHQTNDYYYKYIRYYYYKSIVYYDYK